MIPTRVPLRAYRRPPSFRSAAGVENDIAYTGESDEPDATA